MFSKERYLYLASKAKKFNNRYYRLPSNINSRGELIKEISKIDFIFPPRLYRHPNNEDGNDRVNRWMQKSNQIEKHLRMINFIKDIDKSGKSFLLNLRECREIIFSNLEVLHTLCMLFSSNRFLNLNLSTDELIPISEFLLTHVKLPNFLVTPHIVKSDDKSKLKQIVSNMYKISDEEKKYYLGLFENNSLITIGSQLFSSERVRTNFLEIHKFFFMTESFDPYFTGLDNGL